MTYWTEKEEHIIRDMLYDMKFLRYFDFQANYELCKIL
jgi:hypothetical protein